MRYYMLHFLFTLIIYFTEVRGDCSNVVIITEFDPHSCDRTKNEFYTKSVGDTCIPGCVSKIGSACTNPLCACCKVDKDCAFGATCEQNRCAVYPGACTGDQCPCCTQDQDCAPGLKCSNTHCVEDPSSEYRCFFQKPTPSWTPACLPDGSFAPKQCKGETQNGRCYCFSKAGTRIYGEEWSNKANNMTCACSRQRSDLEKQGRTDVTLHCDTVGNFEPLQCDSEACWCADPQTGDVVASVVPEEMMSILPCYKESKVGAQYLRRCESQLIAQNKIRSEFSTHGTNNLALPYIECDWNGGYGRRKVDKNLIYCSWMDGKNIYSYAGQRSQLKSMTCNCARDSMIYEAAGKELTKVCSAIGNYDLLQHFDEKSSYCIDHDGFLTHGPEENLEDCTPYLP